MFPIGNLFFYLKIYVKNSATHVILVYAIPTILTFV